MKFTYHLSDKHRDQVWVETGKRPSQYAELTIPDEELPTEIRQALLQLPRRAGGVELGSLKEDSWDFGFDVPVKPLVADGPINAEEAYKTVLAMSRAYPILRAALDAKKKAYHEQQAAEKKEREEAALLERERRAREAADREAERSRREALRAQWAEEHGSLRLKKCFKEGYDCSRLYEVERAALEYPGFILDYNDTASWKDRSGPSEQAFAELDKAREIARPGAQVKIVWLTAAPTNQPEQDPYEEDFEPCEAIAIFDTNYSEWLVKTL